MKDLFKAIDLTPERQEITNEEIRERHFQATEIIAKMECKELNLSQMRGFREQAIAMGFSVQTYEERVSEIEAEIFDLRLLLTKHYRVVIDRIEAPLNEGL